MLWLETIKRKLEPVWLWFTVLQGNAKTEARRKRKDPGRDHTVRQAVDTVMGARANATNWDVIINGFNRLPRPLLTVAILGFFLIAPLYPDEFLKVATAYQKMPNGFWALLSVVVGFYFTGRMQSKSHAMRIHEALEEGVEKKANANDGDNVVVNDADVPQTEVDYQKAEASSIAKKPNQVIGQWKINK